MALMTPMALMDNGGNCRPFALILWLLGFNFRLSEASHAKMNAFARKWVGAGILGISLLIGLFLHLSGVPLMSLVSSQTTIYSNEAMATAVEFKIHWSLVTLFTAGSLGLCLLLIPSKKKLPPKICPEPKV